jgi:hypothetical protein
VPEALAIARHYKTIRRNSDVSYLFHALNKDGVHGAASLWRNGYEENKQALRGDDGSERAWLRASRFR